MKPVENADKGNIETVAVGGYTTQEPAIEEPDDGEHQTVADHGHPADPSKTLRIADQPVETDIKGNHRANGNIQFTAQSRKVVGWQPNQTANDDSKHRELQQVVLVAAGWTCCTE